ncbi:MAG TPA: DUF3828 domain-containing protein [Dongiaceae bacterium]|nr:DUF3828 domain-containing protein [Dongiaceae bacterium]
MPHADLPSPACNYQASRPPRRAAARPSFGGTFRRLIGLPRPAFAALVLLALLPFSATAAEQSPRAFLQAIYQHYIGTNTSGVKLDEDADYRRYFTPELAQMIISDNTKAAQNGDIPTLDGDPFIDAQDWSIGKVQIDVDDKATGKTVAKVSFKNLGKTETVTLDLVEVDGAWKIDDIHWPEDSLRGLYKQ